MEEFIADLIVGVSVDESKGKYFTKDGYTYIKYSIIGLVGIKRGEPNFIPVDVYDVSDSVKHITFDDFDDMTLFVKLDSSNRCLCCLISTGKKFDSVIQARFTKNIYRVVVFDRRLHFLYGTDNSKKVYYDIFGVNSSSIGSRCVSLEIDIETMSESIVTRKYIRGEESFFSNHSSLMLDCIEPICDKLQDGVYVHGDTVILYEIREDSIILPNECKYVVFNLCYLKEIVFGSKVEYIGIKGSSFSGVQKIYISKDSSKEFIGCLLQSIYFSGNYNKLYSKHSLLDMQSISGEEFYSICNEKRNAKIVESFLQNRQIIVY